MSDEYVRRLLGTGEAGDEVSGDVEALAEVIYTALEWSGCEGSRWARVPESGRRQWKDIAATILASDWLAAYVAAEQDRAWGEGYNAAVVNALTLRAALPAEPTGEGTRP